MRTQKLGQLGVNVVENIVLRENFRARWQQVDAHNDDGVDGLIFLENSSGVMNGKIVFAQVKRLKIKPVNGKVKISFGIDKIKIRRTNWSSVAGASILIWVNPEDDIAYWSDLMSDSSFDGGSVVVDLKSKFDVRSRQALSRLSGTVGADMSLPTVMCEREDMSVVHVNRPLRAQAREFYRAIGTVSPASPEIPSVLFGRVGWQHITRPSRPISRIFQSLTLLGAAKRIVEQVPTVKLVRSLSNPDARLFTLTARVIFPHRDAAVVRVNLLQKMAGPGEAPGQIWFYSVYEVRRRRGILGE